MTLLKFLKALRVYMFNKFFTKIPFAVIRLLFVRCYITLGKESNVLTNTIFLNKELSKDQIIIGNNCVINQDCIIDGRGAHIKIQNNVDIGRGTWIFTLEHDPHDDFHKTRAGKVVIEKNVWIATRVTILPGVTIGEGSVVACGAVVTKDIPPHSIAGGVPAKIIGKRNSKCKYKLNFFPILDIGC